MATPTQHRRGQKFFIILACLATAIIILSLLLFTFWLLDNHSTAENTSIAIENADLTELPLDEATENTEENADVFDPYWDFHDVNYLAADFSQLKQLNPEIVAWLSLSGTDINYPITQHQDNTFYLNHSIDQSSNDAGWAFLDYRNHSALQNRNTIIYAHGRQDGSMFGSLKRTLTADWRADPNNFLIKTSTPSTNAIWQIFSTYQIPDTNDYIQTDFADDDDFVNFLQMLQNRSNFNYHVEVKPSDQILTLSTCANTTASDKIVVHAKLIRSQNR